MADHTRAALQRFRGLDGPHEGLVYWAGRRSGEDTLVLGALLPASDHGPQHVFVGEREVGRMSRRARALGLAIVAQVHSHPGRDTRHSDGDDTLILMPFEGMFSLVVADYGRGAITPVDGAGLHQYQDRRWVQVAAECADAMLIVPPLAETVP
ncbi:MAG TPA: Mov34/MPN/PAD-1 family protein [Trebonia sp.]|nr:Mov34/MPN/PAD-1 family protein [Trebonia sp.]